LARVPNSISQPILDIPSVCIPISQMYVDMLQDSLTSVHNSFRFLQPLIIEMNNYSSSGLQ